MSASNIESSAMLRIAAGGAVFFVASVVQATMGDSHMFSMTYTDRGALASLLVNATFFPGWLLSLALVGTGVGQILDGSAGKADPKPWDGLSTTTEAGVGSGKPFVMPKSDPPSPTRIQLERDPRLARAVQLGAVHYRTMWFITRRPQLSRSALLAASKDTNLEVDQALRDLKANGLVHLLPDGTLRAVATPPES